MLPPSNEDVRLTRIAVAFNPWQAFSRPALSGARAFLSAQMRTGEAAKPGESAAEPLTDSRLELVDVYSRWIDDFPDLIARADCAGIILSLSANDYAVIRERLPPDLPRVNCGADLTSQQIPSVVPDAQVQMNLAVAHLLDGGCRSIGYVGLTDSALCSTHVRNLNERLGGSGVKLSAAWLTWPRDERADPPRPTPEFQRWLLELPRPCGIIASTYAFAAWALHTFLACDVPVPDTAAILSVLDGDTCEMSHPSITALQTDGFRMGWESMRLLQAQFAIMRPPASLVQVDAIDLVQRESTPRPSDEARIVQQALEFIRANATKRIGIADVVRHLGGISRSRLYAIFTARVGHSLAAHIRQVRLLEACRLLATTDDTVVAIASRCGFSGAKQLTQLLRRERGMTPGEYRQKMSRDEASEAADSVPSGSFGNN